MNSRQSPDYTGKYRWEVGQKPLHNHAHNQDEDALAYRDMAEERIERYDAILGQIGASLNFPLALSGAQAKEGSSCKRKLWDRTTSFPGQADKITDYLRARGTVPESAHGARNVGKTIDALINHPLTVGYKDQFFVPNRETGYRSFIALIDVDGLKAELQIEYAGMRPINDITENLRKAERALRQAELIAPFRCATRAETMVGSSRAINKFTAHAESTICNIREIRKLAHEADAEKNGLNILLSPSLRMSPAPDHLSDLGNAFFAATKNSMFGRVLKNVGSMMEREFPALFAK